MSKTKRRARQRAAAQEQAMEMRFEAEAGAKAANAPPPSMQPRLIEREDSAGLPWADYFTALLSWADDTDDLPPWPSHGRDAALRDFWKGEPLLAGVINSVVQLAANRGWSLEGPPRQVDKFHRILMDEAYGPGNTRGWRALIRGIALDYYTTDNGAWIEIIRAGRNGPLAGLAHLDSERMTTRRDWRFPALYEPLSGVAVKLRPHDFIRLVELPDTSERTRGWGFCAVSRAALLARTLRALWLHDAQKLSNLPPQGFLLLKKILMQQWNDVMKAERAGRERRGQSIYPGLRVMAGDADSDAIFVPFSQVPDQ